MYGKYNWEQYSLKKKSGFVCLPEGCDKYFKELTVTFPTTDCFFLLCWKELQSKYNELLIYYIIY